METKKQVVKPMQKMTKAELLERVNQKDLKIKKLKERIEKFENRSAKPLRMKYKFTTNRYTQEYLDSVIARTKLLFKIEQTEDFIDETVNIRFEYRQFEDGNYVILYNNTTLYKLFSKPLKRVVEIRFYDNLDVIKQKKEEK